MNRNYGPAAWLAVMPMLMSAVPVAAQDEAAPVDSPGDSGIRIYVGADYDQATVDISDAAVAAELGRSRFSSDFIKLRIGLSVFDGIAFEVHGAVPASNAGGDEIETAQFFGLYFVPTGVVAETIEVSARLGYAITEIETGLGSEDLDGVSFGLNFELPLRRLGASLPDLRFSAGGTVYQEDREARVYGYHGGLRYDFRI